MKIFFTFLVLVGNSCFCQTLKNSEKDSLILGIKKTLLENYVISEKAKLIADSLISNTYYTIENMDSLTKKLNRDLFRYSNDKHLFLQYLPRIAQKLDKNEDVHIDQDIREKNEQYGFEKISIEKGNVGYIYLKYFANAANAKKAVFSYLKKIKHTEALIIDLRGNSGGNGTMLQLLTGIFLPEKETEILKINYNSGKTIYLKSSRIPSRKKYIKQPVYILCDNKTFSAGEAFALIMNNRKRATLIGDTTAGAGNIAGPYSIQNQFVLNVPVGIIVDPLTNKGWEHIGVTPHIIIEPIQAFEKAMSLAKEVTKQ